MPSLGLRRLARAVADGWTWTAVSATEGAARSWTKTLIALAAVEANLYFALAGVWFNGVIAVVYIALWVHGAVLLHRRGRT